MLWRLAQDVLMNNEYYIYDEARLVLIMNKSKLLV